MIGKPLNLQPVKAVKGAPRALLYARVSSDKQTEGTSLTEQHIACKVKAEAIGAQVVGYYEDAGVSGGLYWARPGIQAALSEIESGNADTLIIAKLDRYSRDREHQAAIKKRVQLAGARLVFCDMDFADTPEGDLQFGILGSFAEYERKVIKERTSKGRRRTAIEKGIQTQSSMRPFGYYIPTKDDVLLGNYAPEQRGKYQIVEDDARWVREMFRRVASGESLHSVARWLNSEGVATPRKGQFWRVSTLKRILNNPVYKGQATFGRHERRHDETLLSREYKQGQNYTQPYVVRETSEEKWIYIDAPALVDEAVWETCNAALSQNQARLGGRPERRYTLSGLIRCPKCERTMHASKRMQPPCPSRIAKHQYNPVLKYVYACPDSRPSRNTGGHQCNPRNYNGTKAERCVIEAVKHAARVPQATEAALAAFYQLKSSTGSEDEYKSLQAQLKDLERRETATIEAQIRGIACGASVSVYEDVLRQIAAQRTQAQEQLNQAAAQRVSATPDDCKDAAQVIAEALNGVDEVLEASELSDGEKRDLLARVVESIYPTEDLETYAVNLKPFTVDALTVATIKTLWPPDAATSSARLTVS